MFEVARTAWRLILGELINIGTVIVGGDLCPVFLTHAFESLCLLLADVAISIDTKFFKRRCRHIGVGIVAQDAIVMRVKQDPIIGSNLCFHVSASLRVG
jgi:hypothetical protein